MTNVNRSCKTEVRSKIGDYIRGKISAHSLMHPSRINTKPIEKRRYNLNTDFVYGPTKTDYQKKTRRPPLKDYIEGKVKLSDMISPSRITYIPKERKFQTEMKTFVLPENDDDSTFDRKQHFLSKECIKDITNEKPEDLKSPQKLSLTTYGNIFTNEAFNSKNELTLIPIKSSVHGCGRKRKLMCKIKVQQHNNALTNGESQVEEHVIEVPERILRDGHGLPKFLLDRYNIPCYVNTSAGQNTSVKNKPTLAILNNYEVNTAATEKKQDNIGKENESSIDYPDAEGENTIMVEIKDESKNTSNDVENLPTEQGDHNNTTTYVFEFYEEVQPETKATTAIIEEVEDDNSHKDYGWSYRRLQETPRSEKYHNYDDFKSSIHFQKELVDLHRGVLKCDKNVMTVERSVNQLTATINILEDTQNQEIKPIVMNVKRANDKMRTQIESLQFENEDLKKTIKYLKKKTIDYDKLIYFIKQSSHSKIQELENKLNTITLAQVKSIEMQNMVNKNIFKITNDIKRSHSELDSKHCCNSIKSPKNSNLTLT